MVIRFQKHEATWSDDEDKASSYILKAINAIYAAIDLENLN